MEHIRKTLVVNDYTIRNYITKENDKIKTLEQYVYKDRKELAWYCYTDKQSTLAFNKEVKNINEKEIQQILEELNKIKVNKVTEYINF